MKLNRLLRQIHYWGSLIVMGPLAIMLIAGIFLMLKKDVDWIQPPTQKGVAVAAVPTQTLDALFATVAGVPELEVTAWTDLSRVDFKPGKGVAKFVSANNWEAQLDTHTGEVLAVTYRRSDIIESLHDGSFFADWVKRFVFLPAGVALLVLWGTGIYLFLLPRVKRKKPKGAG